MQFREKKIAPLGWTHCTCIFLQMKELEKGDRNSKSLLANVLDLEGDFILAPGGLPLPTSMSGSLLGIDNKGT